MGSGSCPGSNTNYVVIGKKEKAKIEINTERLPEIKEAILSVLREDKKFWTEREKPQQGVEKNILLRKVRAMEKTATAPVFNYLLEELEQEQKIIPTESDNLVRFIYFDLGNIK